MKALLKVVYISITSILVTSCGVDKIYTSASYGSLKTYTEKPIYSGKKEVANYISGSFRNAEYPQRIRSSTNNERINDKATGGNFSFHSVVTDKRINFYYGLGASFGNYQFKSDLKNMNPNLDNVFNKNDKLEYYNVNLKVGINHKLTLKKMEFSFIGLELIYVNEFGSYIDKLNNIPQQVSSNVVIANEKSIFAFNLNTEITYRINNVNNIGIGAFVGNILLNNKEKIRNEGTSIGGLTFKYNHKNITISVVTENSTRNITSTRVGVAYRISKKVKTKRNKTIDKLENEDLRKE